MFAYQKLGQSDLLYGSKSPAENSVREQTFSSQLSLTARGMLVLVPSLYVRFDTQIFNMRS